MRAPLLSILVLLATAAPAAAQWSPPQNVSSGHEFVDNPTLAFSSTGTGLATWTAQDGTGTSATSGTYDAPLGSPERLVSRSAVISKPVLYGSTRAAAARLAGNRLSIVFGRTDGSFGAPELIADRANIRSVVLAGNAQGDLALAWFEDRGVTTDRVYIAFRPVGKPWTPPLLQATDRVRSVSVAVSPKGALLLAYDARGTIKARYKPATAPLFRHVQTIQSEPTFFAKLRTAVTGNGRAYIGWAAQFLSEGGDVGDGFYEVAVQPAGALKFRPAQLLEQRPATEIVGGLDLTTNAANGATVAWGATTVKAAVTNASATFGAPITVAPGLEAAMAGAPDGRVLVAYIVGSEAQGALMASIGTGGVFGAPETVTAGPQARVPAAAYDATNNRWALVWSNRPSGSPPTFLQMSSEPGGPPGEGRTAGGARG
jgi:hypothetical protein